MKILKQNYVFNPGSKSFKKFLNNNIFFVDKTDLIHYINEKVNTSDRFICVSRPRRFGKTVTADMLTAYYSFSNNPTDVFNNKKISKQKNWKKFLGKFNVIHLNMVSYFSDCSIKKGIKKIKEVIVDEVEDTIENFKFKDKNDMIRIFQDIQRNTNRDIVLIIDEWDCVFRENLNDEKSQKKYLKFLNKFIKDNNYIALTYMTGILPVKKYGENSAINNFLEISMTSPIWMAKYVGFTEDEIKELFKKCIGDKNPDTKQNNSTSKRQKLDKNNKKDKEKNINDELIHKNELSLDNIKKWYDGYKLENEETHELFEIYSPLSITEAFKHKVIKNYWNKTETYFVLKKYIKKNYFGLKQDIVRLRNRKKIKINIDFYQNDMTSFTCKDDILTMLVHLGYLTYNISTKQVHIPNEEVLKEFENSTQSSKWNYIDKKLKKSEKLLKATWDCNEDKVAELIENFHNEVNNESYNSEDSLRFTLRLAYYVADEYYNEYIELDSGKGYVDISYIPIDSNSKYPALVIELKYNKNAKTAMNQIKEKQYPQKLERYQDNLLLIGIKYDKKAKRNGKYYKRHTCIIENFVNKKKKEK